MMSRVTKERRGIVLVLVLGLLAAPAAMADPGRDQGGPEASFTSIDRLFQDLWAEVTSWFGDVSSEWSSDGTGGTTPDLFGFGPSGSGDEDDSDSTDSGPSADPNG